MLIQGKNFGPTIDTLEGVLYRNTKDVFTPTYHANVSDCVMTVPHEELRCLTVEGAGRQLEWSLVVANQV